MSFYIEVATEEEFYFFAKYSKLCVVDFHASWCGPCKKLAPLLSQKITENIKYQQYLLLDKSSNITVDDVKDKIIFVKVDVTKLAELSGTFGVSSIPYLCFFKGGNLQSGTVKGLDVNAVISYIDEYLF